MNENKIVMMRMRIHKIWIVLFSAGIATAGCNKWDDHNAITDPAVTQNLFEQISADTSLSKFASLLTKTGYDKVIASSKTFTVFAPVNAALAALDAATENDPAKLKLFIGNHIAPQSYYTSAVTTSLRIKMLNGKYNNMLAKNVEEATITAADKYSKNGVLQKVNKILPALNNCWETLEKNAAIPSGQKSYLLSLFRKVFDTTHAVQTGVDPNTGKPVYQPGTDSITTNLFWRNVHDLGDESKQFTFLVLADAAWDAEVTKFKPFCATGTADSTTDISRWTVVKDLAVEGSWTPATLPDTIVSKSGVKVPVTKADIVQTIKTSNGTVYIMSKADVQPQHKILPYFIETENYRATSADRRNSTFFRDRFNPLTGKDFRDLLVYNHGLALFNINYQLKDVYSIKYKAYWVAVNDFQAASFNQKLGIGTTASTAFGYFPVTANNYNEVLLGEFTQQTFQSVLDVFLIANNSVSAATNPIVCDYIRLVPSF